MVTTHLIEDVAVVVVVESRSAEVEVVLDLRLANKRNYCLCCHIV